MGHKELSCKNDRPHSHKYETPLTGNRPVTVMLVPAECTLDSKTDGSANVGSHLGPSACDSCHLRGAARYKVDAERIRSGILTGT